MSCLGVRRFGQSGDLAELYEHHEIDAESVVGAALDLLDSCRSPLARLGRNGAARAGVLRAPDNDPTSQGRGASMPHGRLFRAALALGVAGSALLAPSASAALDEVNSKKLRDAVTINGVLAHERALQQIANLNGGTRASGTPGYDASAAYVAERLRRAGYRVAGPGVHVPVLPPLAARRRSPSDGTDVRDRTTTTSPAAARSPGEIVPALDNIVPMDPDRRPSTSNAGCEPEDFAPASATEDQIALIQRGTCDFGVKAENAQAAGYDAAIIFNEGQPGAHGALAGTLGRILEIPVIALSYADGAALQRRPRRAR